MTSEVVSFVAGSGSSSSYDGTGLNAGIYRPAGVAFDTKKNHLLFSEIYSHRIRTVSPEGKVETFAGSSPGFMNGYR